MTFTRCFSSLGCPELSLDEMFALAARHRIGAVELRALRGTVELPRQLAADFGSPDGLVARLRAPDAVPIVALNTSLRLIGDDAVARNAFLEFLPWAEALGGVRLRVFDGGRSGDERELSEAADTIAWWRELRAKHGWHTDIMIETHDTLLTGAAIQRLWQQSPGAPILWDTHHTWRRGGENPLTTWQSIRTGVCHVHVKDSVPMAGARLPFTYVLPGRGEFPMQTLRERLKADRFAGPVSLEWEQMWHRELPQLDDALTMAQVSGWW